jgi:hypothetical protein
MHYIISYLHFIPCAFSIFIYVLIHIGSAKGVTLLEFELEGQETPQEIPQQEVPKGEGQVQEELPECPDHHCSANLKGKPQGILCLPCFINTNLSSLCLMHYVAGVDCKHLMHIISLSRNIS